MPSIEEAKQRIAVANSESQKLNSIRQQNIGRRETLQKQFETNLKAYNDKFGTSITVETLLAEQERVVTEKVKEVEKVEGVINAINSGNYALANELSGVKPEETSTSVQPTSEQVETQSTPVAQTVVPSSEPVVSTPVQQATSPAQVVQSAEPVVSTPVQSTPVTQPVTPNPAPQTTPKTDLASLFSDEDDTPASPIQTPIGGTPLGQPLGVGINPSSAPQPVQSNSGLNGALAGFESLGASTTPTPPPAGQSQPNTSFSSLLNNNQFSDL